MKRIPITVRPRKNNNRNIRHKSALYAKTIKTQLIGLTGGIASGKSTVSAYLESLGFSVIDTDHIVKDLFNRKEILQKIGSTFKTVDKAKIREIIFSSAAKKKWLENLLHPKVWQEVKKRSKGPLVFVIVPLLFETGSARRFKATITISAPKYQQLERLTRRDGITKSLALKMIHSQWPNYKKEKKADYVIKNNRNLSQLHKNTKAVLEKLIETQ